MFQVNNSNNKTQYVNYLVSVAADGNPKIIRTRQPQGFETPAAAKEARIEEIQNDIRCYRRTMNDYLDELEEGTKGRKLQDDVGSYLEAIANYQSDIVDAEREQVKIRNLNP